MTPESDSPFSWLKRNICLTPGMILVYFVPLALGMTLPGDRITAPGWIDMGFKRYLFVALIVLLQIACFVGGWIKSEGIFPKILATLYIPVISYWLVRDYFFGVEADFDRCFRFVSFFCFLTILYDSISAGLRRSRKQKRKD